MANAVDLCGDVVTGYGPRGAILGLSWEYRSELRLLRKGCAIERPRFVSDEGMVCFRGHDFRHYRGSSRARGKIVRKGTFSRATRLSCLLRALAWGAVIGVLAARDIR